MSCNSNSHATAVNYRITLSANFVSVAVAFLQPWSLVDWQVGRFFSFCVIGFNSLILVAQSSPPLSLLSSLSLFPFHTRNLLHAHVSLILTRTFLSLSLFLTRILSLSSKFKVVKMKTLKIRVMERWWQFLVQKYFFNCRQKFWSQKSRFLVIKF